MAIRFIISYWVTKIAKDVLKRHFSKESQNTVQIKNPVGGSMPAVTDDTEMSIALLTFLSDQGS